MTQFVAIDPACEVNGETVLSVVEGSGGFASTARRILAQNGIPDPIPGQWYPQQSWLNAFRYIAEKIGDAALFTIGRAIPDSAQWPPQITEWKGALASIDVAYHLNHRIHGKVLFDPATGKVSEGIGHYRYHEADPNTATITCDNPYPCKFDEGIITAVARKFSGGKRLNVAHTSASCRNRRGQVCTYTVSGTL